MNTLWHKVWSDLWLSRSRTLLAIASIAAGVFCVGTLFGMIALHLGKMDEAHSQSNPSHINLILRQSADDALINGVQAIEGIAGIDTLTPVSMRFRQDESQNWQIATVILRAAPEQQHFDLSALESGHWPQQGELAIENLTAQVTGLKQGDSVQFSDEHGIQQFIISGVVRHPFVKPPRFGGQAHFFADRSQAKVFGLKAHSFRQLLLQTHSLDALQIRQYAQTIKTWLLTQGIDVSVTLLQNPEQHWGRPFIAGIDQVLQWMALVSLLLASVLIANTVSAHISQQAEQIGVMKALGASLITISKLYALEVLIMALLAIAIALLPSLYVADWSACQLLGLFNIACHGFSYSPQALLIMLVGGLCVPLLAAAWPVWVGARLTVREALASYGLGSDFGSHKLDRAIEYLGARFLPTVYAAALGNLFRRKTRLVLTQMVLIIAGLMFLVLMSLITSLNLTLDNELARTEYTVRLGFGRDQAQSDIEKLSGLSVASGQLELWQRLPVLASYQGQVLQQQGSLGLQVLAVPASGHLYQPYIEQGRWFEAADAGKNKVVVSADTARLNQLKPGDSMELRIGSKLASWQIIGVYRWLAGNNFAVEPLYAPLETVQTLSNRQALASYALIKADINSQQQEAEYLRKLSTDFEAQGISLDAYTTQARLEQRQFARNQFRSVIGTLMGLASMVVAVGGIGLSGALAIGVLQRQRELGVLRAIGASGRTLLQLVMLEGLWHALIAWTLTVPLAWWLAEPLSAQLGQIMLSMQLDYRFASQAAGAWLLVLIALALLASYWPARQAMRLTVREALH